MNRFIIKVAVFLMIPLFYFCINGFINYFIYSNYVLKLKKSNILIVGDSHTQKALNPSLFKSTLNISKSAEPLILTYWKVKKVFESNKIDTLILGFAPHNLAEYNDFKFSKGKWADEMFKRSYTIEEFENINTIEVDYSKYYKVLWKQTCFYPKFNHNYYTGKYSNYHKSNLSDVNDAINRHYYFNDQELGVSETAISYLDSLITLCHNNNITLFLVSTPVHNSYYNRIPLQVKLKYEDVKNNLIKKGITIFDMTTEYYPDSLFLNADHLNHKGAEIFTSKIKELIKIPLKQKRQFVATRTRTSSQ